jgi:hypothetical protein
MRCWRQDSLLVSASNALAAWVGEGAGTASGPLLGNDDATG